MDTEKMTATEVGKLFEVTHQAVSKWGKVGCPRNADGTFRLDQVIQWWDRRQREKVRIRSPSLERLRAARAETEERKLAKLKNSMVVVKDMKAGVIARIKELRRVLLPLSKAAAPELVGLDAREIQEALKYQVETRIRIFSR